MDILIQPGTDIDIRVFDQLISAFYGNGEHTQEANNILMKFNEREDAYLCTKPVLMSDCNTNTKFFSLLVLKNNVKIRWQCFSYDLKMEIKELLFFVIKEFIDSGDKKYLALISQVNQIIVEIAKYDWPHTYTEFMNDVFSSFWTTPRFKCNFFAVLKILLDEIDESSENSLTSVRAEEMRYECSKYVDQLIGHIQESFKTNNDNLIKSALSLFGRLVNYFNPIIVLSTHILNDFILCHLSNPSLSISVISVLVQIISITKLPQDYHHIIIELFAIIVDTLSKIVNDQFSTVTALSGDETFIDNFIEAITSFLIEYGSLVETEEHEVRLNHVLSWILSITGDANIELFEDCIEYWRCVLQRIFLEVKNGVLDRDSTFLSFLPDLRRILVAKMPPPVQSLHYFESDSTETKKYNNSSILTSVYSSARECIVFLTNFDPDDMIEVILNQVYECVNGSLDASSIKSMCWSIGAIPGAIEENLEKYLYQMTERRPLILPLIVEV